MDNKKKKVDIRYIDYNSEFEPPTPLPFGAHKYIKFDGSKVVNHGTILSTTFTCALIVDGVEGEPFQYTKVY